MGLTVPLSLPGGAGTKCVAFGAEKYGSVISPAPFILLDQVLAGVALLIAPLDRPRSWVQCQMEICLGTMDFPGYRQLGRV